MEENKQNLEAKSGRSNWGEFREADETNNRKPKGKVLLELPRTSQQDSVKIEPYTTTSSHFQPEEDSSTTDSSEIDESLQGNSLLKKRIVHHISKCKGDVFFKSQQRDDPKLSRSEKKQIVASLLESSPSNFLLRYGKHMDPAHLPYFHQFQDSYEVSFHLKQLEKSTLARKKIVKNRRYQAMQELIDKGDYFSMMEMRSRNPLLFKHLIEKHMTSEEKEELEPAQSTCSLSTVLMAHMDRDQYSSTRRKEQEAEQMAWNGDGQSDIDDNEGEMEEVDDDEKELLRDEFVSIMHKSFLEGHDKDFDYSLVDDNQDYDNIVLCERDAEERYFDSD